jgi:hypothetical protein
MVSEPGFFTSANPSRRYSTCATVTLARYWSSRAGTVHAALFISPQYCPRGVVHPRVRHCSCGIVHLTTGSLPRAVTIPDDTEAAALRTRLEAIVKEAENAEAQAAVARHRIQAARLLLEEEFKATALEQTATAARQRVPSSSSSSSSPVAASQLVPTASSTYKDTVVAGLHLQAAAVLNVRQLVSIVLDSSSTNYASWRDLMEHALQR